jgi:hypothetical protein
MLIVSEMRIKQCLEAHSFLVDCTVLGRFTFKMETTMKERSKMGIAVAKVG